MMRRQVLQDRRLRCGAAASVSAPLRPRLRQLPAIGAVEHGRLGVLPASRVE